VRDVSVSPVSRLDRARLQIVLEHVVRFAGTWCSLNESCNVRFVAVTLREPHHAHRRSAHPSGASDARRQPIASAGLAGDLLVRAEAWRRARSRRRCTSAPNARCSVATCSNRARR
jgi:hypothetical protein